MELELSTLVIQLALIFLPGLLWAGMNSAVVAKGEVKTDRFLLLAFFFGIVSYLIVYAAYSLIGAPFSIANLDEADRRAIITSAIAREIAWALLAAFACGVVNIYVATYGLFFRFLRLIHASNRYGADDVWDFTFNLRDGRVDYVHLRDFDQKLVYAGWVVAFSETGRLRELTLRDVQVFDFEGRLFYEVSGLYIARKPENVHVEFPVKPL